MVTIRGGARGLRLLVGRYTRTYHCRFRTPRLRWRGDVKLHCATLYCLQNASAAALLTLVRCLCRLNGSLRLHMRGLHLGLDRLSSRCLCVLFCWRCWWHREGHTKPRSAGETLLWRCPLHNRQLHAGLLQLRLDGLLRLLCLLPVLLELLSAESRWRSRSPPLPRSAAKRRSEREETRRVRRGAKWRQSGMPWR